MQHLEQKEPGVIHILLADDDNDDCYMFSNVLSEIPISTQLTIVSDGEKLMGYLSKHLNFLPDVLFLDLNMPRKNGAECLTAIKSNKKLKRLPIIIYSTSCNKDVVDIFYRNGAYYYICKTNFTEFKKSLHYILQLMAQNKFAQASREKFVLGVMKEQPV